MAASIPWTEFLLCVWTVIVAVVAYRVGRRMAGDSPTVGRYDYQAVVRRDKPASDLQEYDDPWSEALRGKGEREETV